MGDHNFHPGQGSDDGTGASGVIEEVAGNIQAGGGHLSGAGIQMFFHRHKDGVKPY